MSQPLLRPPSVAKSRIDDPFWNPRIAAVRAGTVPVFYERCREAGMIDHIDPDVKVKPRAKLAGVHGSSAQRFWDSDLGKLIEMAGYVLVGGRDADLEARIDAIVDRFGRMQAPDGYLNSWFTYQEPGKRWTNLRDDHELYCAGHLIEGAIAYFDATGKRKLLDILIRYVDHIIATLGPNAGQKPGYCGHPEIELALVSLYRVTGDKRHLDLARYFVDERGKQPLYFDIEARARGVDPAKYFFGNYEYCQAHKPVREQDKVVGHAVRAMYLYSGMADIAAETNDESLTKACERLWADLASKRLYATGGMGPSAHNEGFTSDYDLPNRTAYAETCAAVGLVFWASRLLQRDCDRRYGDMMELALYNGALSGLSLDGTLFFYENPLESRGDHRRWKWHRCPCCPPNIGRLVASLGRYVYGAGNDTIAVHLFVGGEAQLEAAGMPVTVRQTTRYPWDGAVKIDINPAREAEFAVMVRIPGWCRDPVLKVNGAAFDLGAAQAGKGYARITRRWSPGDKIELDLRMTVELQYANPEVADDAGRVALRRGPLLYCLEACDNPAPPLRMRVVDASMAAAKFEPSLMGGVVTVTGDAQVEQTQDWGATLYRSEPPRSQPGKFKAVPYYAWDNREAGEMLVWLRRT